MNTRSSGDARLTKPFPVPPTSRIRRRTELAGNAFSIFMKKFMRKLTPQNSTETTWKTHVNWRSTPSGLRFQAGARLPIGSMARYDRPYIARLQPTVRRRPCGRRSCFRRIAEHPILPCVSTFVGDAATAFIFRKMLTPIL